ncbi:MAG: NADH-quinone oxidoreductase subunit L [Desulfobaccales bacterium]
METVLLLLLLFPLGGALINAGAGRLLPRRCCEVIACAGVLGSLAMAGIAMAVAGKQTFDLSFLSWIQVGEFSAAMNVHYDPLAAMMALMVTFVSSLIHVYSVAFMRDDADYVRYFSYLNLFVFAMLVITVADNLIFVYLGWEGVGFCSYALIGFWYGEAANVEAGRKAFIVTRIGDVAFGVALALLFVVFRSFSLSYIDSHVAALTTPLATVLALLLLWAAAGKSAQLPLTVWLPDAMAGPTPVSALIHAATMVTAGVYLLMRLFPVVQMAPVALYIIAAIGSITTLYAALAALAQSDVKRMLAYSTISQVGYMILAVGAADIVGGMFHLLSHAFFKALLFLGAGCVIQAMEEEHNIFKMGNLHRLMPMVSYLFLAGALCLSAFPLLGGYFSKDRILLATFIYPDASYKIFWFLGLVAAFLTPLYTFRAYFIIFRARAGGRGAQEVRPLPGLMVWVLVPLAVLAVFDGLLNLPGGIGKNFLGSYLATVPGARPDLGAPLALEWSMGILSASVVVVSLILAYVLYVRRPAIEPLRQGFHEFLFSGLYLDRLYQTIFVRPYRSMTEFMKVRVEEEGIDAGIVAGATALFQRFWETARFLWLAVDERSIDESYVKGATGLVILSRGLGYWTTGRLSTYVKMLLLGLTAFLVVLVWGWFD